MPEDTISLFESGRTRKESCHKNLRQERLITLQKTMLFCSPIISPLLLFSLTCWSNNVPTAVARLSGNPSRNRITNDAPAVPVEIFHQTEDAKLGINEGRDTNNLHRDLISSTTTSLPPCENKYKIITDPYEWASSRLGQPTSSQVIEYTFDSMFDGFESNNIDSISGGLSFRKQTLTLRNTFAHAEVVNQLHENTIDIQTSVNHLECSPNFVGVMKPQYTGIRAFASVGTCQNEVLDVTMTFDDDYPSFFIHYEPLFNNNIPDSSTTRIDSIGIRVNGDVCQMELPSDGNSFLSLSPLPTGSSNLIHSVTLFGMTKDEGIPLDREEDDDVKTVAIRQIGTSQY